MSATPPPAERPGVLGSFHIADYRRLWIADIFSAFGAEMETIILGWYVLERTDSAFLVSVVAALRFGGTLLAPAAGVAADRLSRRSLLIGLRASYAALAAALAIAALGSTVPLALVFLVAGLSGLLRPCEMILRQSLIADVVPTALLTNALGFGRTTMESARIVGPLAGAALLSAFGLGIAYAAVTAVYVASIAASVRILPRARSHRAPAARPWAELLQGLAYIRETRPIRTALVLAFMVNLTAFPMITGLLPVIARDVFGADENGLARMAATAAGGALASSVLVAVAARNLRPERLMLWSLILWHLLIAAFAAVRDPVLAYVLLALLGLVAGAAMIPMAVVLMAHARAEYRGRVMGVRMLAVYGLPLGLLAGGALIEWVGIPATLALYAAVGLLPAAGVLARGRATEIG